MTMVIIILLLLNKCMLGNFSCFVFCRIFSKSTFKKNSFTNTFRVINNLDPDQAQRFVGPDLVLANCMLFCGLLIFSQSTFQNKFFQKYLQCQNNLDPDKARLQRFSVVDSFVIRHSRRQAILRDDL